MQQVCIGNHPLSYGLGWGQNHVASDGREDVDRQAISLEQEDLVKLVKTVNPNTVLILVSSFPYAIPWSRDNIPAILHVTQSSQELGNGVADIVFGEVSPAGRLVQTWSSSIDHERVPPPLLAMTNGVDVLLLPNSKAVVLIPNTGKACAVAFAVAPSEILAA